MQSKLSLQPKKLNKSNNQAYNILALSVVV